MAERAWCFTINNYSESDCLVLDGLPVEYLIYGKEVGASGTPHLQGYLYRKAKYSLRQLKKLFPRAHLEVSKGTPEDNREYCSKEGNFTERGVLPLSQVKKGLAGAAKYKEMWALAKSGEFESLPPAQIKTWEYIHAKYSAPSVDRSELDNLWISGPTGAGKSKYIRETYPVFFTKSMSKWWDAYNGEPVIVIDDFAPEHGKYLGYYLKIWADHYVFPAEVKGGMLRIRPQTIIVTSQYALEECFEDPETVKALLRRFKKKFCTSDDSCPYPCDAQLRQTA